MHPSLGKLRQQPPFKTVLLTWIYGVSFDDLEPLLAHKDVNKLEPGKKELSRQQDSSLAHMSIKSPASESGKVTRQKNANLSRGSGKR